MYLKLFLIILIPFFIGCEERTKPIVIKSPSLTTPIKCMSLNKLNIDKEFIDRLERLYPFRNDCNLKLNVSYKNNIICNSGYNIMRKTTGKFPKSYLKFELRKGMKLLYSYYIDLYSNVNGDEIERSFLEVKSDLLQ